MSFDVKFAWQDSRRSRRRLLLFLSAMALGVAALVAIQSFSDQMARSVEQEAREIAGADVNVYARRVFSDRDQALIDSLAAAHNAEVAQQMVFTSMAFFPTTGDSRLVQVRATEGGFPFYGSLSTTPVDAADGFVDDRAALVDRSLLLQFDIPVGDSVRIGERTYPIAGSLDATTGQPDVAAFVAPRVYVPLADLDPALTALGSRIESNAYMRLPAGASAEAMIESSNGVLQQAGFRSWTATSIQQQWTDSLGDLGRFLALVAFVALLLGGIGVASSIAVYIRQKTETIATLRCIGAPAGLLLRVYAIQAGALGLIAALIGAALGLAVQSLLPAVLGPFLPVAVAYGISWRAIAIGLGVGIAVALGFALLPLLRVRRVPPLAAIRPDAASSESARHESWTLLIALLLAVGVAGFAYLQTGSVIAALLFPVSLGVAVAVLAGAARLVMALARKLVPRRASFTLRQGMANLHRPGNQTGVLLTTLGLGTGLLLVLFLVQATLLGRIMMPAGGAEQPGLILFDVQPDQVERVEQMIRDQGAPVIERAPVVSMRIRAVNDRQIAMDRGEALDGPGRDQDWALRREYRSTYRDHLSPTERVVAGTFTPAIADPDQPAPISLSSDIADDLGVQLGDHITWDVGGIPIETVVGSLREVDWARIQPNFFAVFPSGVLEEAPQFNIITTRTDSPESDALLQRELVRAFPSVSVVDVGLVIGLVEGVVDRVAFVLQFMALFAFATGLIVLAGAVRVSRLARLEEGILLRTIGASKAQVRLILLAEYLLLGFLAVIVGAAIAYLGAFALARFAFDAPLAPSFGALILALVLMPILTAAVGILGSRGVLDQSPLAVLRQVD